MSQIFAALARRADTLATCLAFEAALAAVGEAEGVSTTDLRVSLARNAVRHSQPGAARRARARCAAIYMTVTALQRSQKAVARVAGVSQPMVHKMVRTVEEVREDPHHDRALDEIELHLMGVA
ncbi:MAG: hypothetical protein ACRCS9_08850 [Hyphomicrobium sp.]